MHFVLALSPSPTPRVRPRPGLHRSWVLLVDLGGVRGLEAAAVSAVFTRGAWFPNFVTHRQPRHVETITMMYPHASNSSLRIASFPRGLARRTLRAASLFVAVCSFTACDDGDGDTQSHDLVGTWIDGFGFEHEITDDTWVSGDSSWTIVEVDAEGQVLFAQNDASNEFSPGLYSRFDWTFDDGGDLYYCQTAFDAASLDAAKATARANDGDLAMGCGGFGWSSLMPY